MLILALILFVPIMSEYAATGLVPRIPTLIVAGFSAIASLVIFGVGLVLDTQGKKSRQSFELQMNILEAIHEAKVSVLARDQQDK